MRHFVKYVYVCTYQYSSTVCMNQYVCTVERRSARAAKATPSLPED